MEGWMLLNLTVNTHFLKLCSLDEKYTNFKLNNFIPRKIAVLMFSDLKRTISEIITDAASPQWIVTKY